jgi:hypothetical protein
MAAGRPILALADPAGDTAVVLRQAGLANVVPLDNVQEIESALVKFLADLSSGAALTACRNVVLSASRDARAKQFSRLLDNVASVG